MKTSGRSFCWSKSRRNADAFEIVDDLAETMNLTKADTLSYMCRDYVVLKNKERLREMQSLGLGH
jgi:hypothetical protein|tara:strand:+ start:1400 stop:1594 length:195 start_codon:yes stop_codon:yes gene_type:complete